jgi:hypothetical protein
MKIRNYRGVRRAYRLLASAAASVLMGVVAITPAHAHEGDGLVGKPHTLSGLISDLYGGDGITLAVGNINPAFSHAAHFTADSLNALANLGGVISGSIGSNSFNSSVSGVTYDFASGAAVRSDLSLGPVIGERAATIGQGRVNIGATYTHIDYKQLDGRKLNGGLVIDLSHDDIPNIDQPFEKDKIDITLNLKLRQEILALTATYGVTDRLDVGILVPIEQLDGKVSAVARIVDNGGNGIHSFDPTKDSPNSSNSASATGVGDILLRAKWRALDKIGGTPFDAAVVGQVTLPTGDKDDLLGTGSSAVYIGGVMSGEFGKITPHLNAGYEYFADEDKAHDIERSNFRMLAGFDINATKSLAFSSDVIARWENDKDKFYDLAIGAKWAPTESSDVVLNFTLPLNRNAGLRADAIVSIGFEAAF